MKFTEHNPLGALFLDACNRFDEKIAARTPAEGLYYGELYATASGLARTLDQLGIGRDSLVGLHDDPARPEVRFSILINSLWLLAAGQWLAQ